MAGKHLGVAVLLLRRFCSSADADAALKQFYYAIYFVDLHHKKVVFATIVPLFYISLVGGFRRKILPRCCNKTIIFFYNSFVILL